VQDYFAVHLRHIAIDSDEKISAHARDLFIRATLAAKYHNC
jgi:hypothetical protein